MMRGEAYAERIMLKEQKFVRSTRGRAVTVLMAYVVAALWAAVFVKSATGWLHFASILLFIVFSVKSASKLLNVINNWNNFKQEVVVYKV